ncbi:cupin domain-containing protein [Undibacterium sp. TJN25]|uniref:AraC family transcriptional regulator n=1 Tax=Undibacterium sp. TJN25 TaxID=3413056 RepID=UPI003BF0EF71
MDHTSTLLVQFGAHAGTFHSGGHCGIANFDEGVPYGHIHLLRAGRMRLVLKNGTEIEIAEPALIFFPGPYHHRLLASQEDKAELVCASIHFDGGFGNPLATALPEYMVLLLADLPSLSNTLNWLFQEAFSDEYGKVAATDRLFELLIIQLLRHILKTDKLGKGILAGLADPRIARVLDLMHARPQHPFSVEELAGVANMSRAGFAAHFKAVIGNTPADYLAGWRISLVQRRLRDGHPISIIAGQVGYESPSALARAFRRKTGVSPREWLARQDAT